MPAAPPASSSANPYSPKAPSPNSELTEPGGESVKASTWSTQQRAAFGSARKSVKAVTASRARHRVHAVDGLLHILKRRDDVVARLHERADLVVARRRDRVREIL